MNQQICTFFLDDQMYGLRVLQIQEVLRVQEFTEVPLAPPAVLGLLNLRGSIVTALDLRQRLGLPPNPHLEAPLNVVAQTAKGLVSLRVDRIGEVVEINPEETETPPGTLGQSLRNLLAGVVPLPTGLLLLIDLERTMELGSSNPKSGA